MHISLKLVAATIAATAICCAPVITQSATPQRADEIRARLSNPNAGIIVVAHRGCHSPSPHHGLPSAPENSLKALDHCIAMGVDVMEADVLRTADGHLVIIHDETVDRTTNGTGRVAQMTLEQLRSLRLRDGLGGPAASLTEERIVTLPELLTKARGAILLNLDIKAAIYPEVIETVVRAGAQKEVIVKTEVGIASPALAAVTPYDRVHFMPILINANGMADLGAIAQRQLDGAHPIAIELPRMNEAQLPALVQVARKHKVRLMMNTLGEGFMPGHGDKDALRDPAGVWGALAQAGVTIFQTDEPDALIRFRADGSANRTRPTGRSSRDDRSPVFR